MSAPAEALTKFWDTLREKSRVRVVHPDLPEDLRTAAGEFTAVLWNKAQVEAQQGLAAFRTEAKSEVREANAAKVAAETERDKARADAAVAQASLGEAMLKVRGIEQQLAADGATKAALERQLDQTGQDIERLQAAVEEARREFAAELDKHRASAQLAEDRFRAGEERALREIDRERTQVSKLQRELDQVRTAATQASDRHQAESGTLHAEAGQLRQRIGVLEGNLQAALSERDRMAADGESLRQLLTEARCQVAGYHSDSVNWKERAEETRQALAKLQAKSAKRSRGRTPAKDNQVLL